jgi:diguanylate cyclase (GGDEF)-like protein
VLIVDDQPANVRVMAEALSDAYEIFFATSGAKALEIAAGAGIDLILLDVVMPGLDGFETCSCLKADERTSAIPVIFVTAREETSDEARGFDVGAVDYITKPIRPTVVRARVRMQLELKRARDLLERLALLDPLTGIGNRRRFDTTLEEEWKRASRTHGWFSLAVVDVDDFKAYNDAYGHARGDDCLRAVAQTLTTVTRRPGDLAARYGGEEFAIILPQTDGEAMNAQMQRLLAEVASLGLTHERSRCSGYVTVSIGAVSVVATPERLAAEVVEAADRLLYQAKENGRNRVVHQTESVV